MAGENHVIYGPISVLLWILSNMAELCYTCIADRDVYTLD